MNFSLCALLMNTLEFSFMCSGANIIYSQKVTLLLTKYPWAHWTSRFLRMGIIASCRPVSRSWAASCLKQSCWLACGEIEEVWGGNVLKQGVSDGNRLAWVWQLSGALCMLKPTTCSKRSSGLWLFLCEENGKMFSLHLYFHYFFPLSRWRMLIIHPKHLFGK